jgi:hypothetical protein
LIEVRALAQHDIVHMLGIIRSHDIMEIEQGCGMGIREALEYGLEHSIGALLMLGDGLPLAALGDVPHGNIGVPWLISTNHIERHARGFLRACRPLFEQMAKRHDVLTNYVDARNLTAIRWLGWLGFEFGEPVAYGPHGLPFKQFTYQRGRD